jgi:pilus assembly protein CpaF
MSLLKRIERVSRPAGEGEAPAVPATTPAPGQPPAPSNGLTSAPAAPPANRPFMGSLPARESFREAKFRVQNRLINELDPKLDLTNQVEVRRQIEDLFGKIAD